jgi:hypothetical protein
MEPPCLGQPAIHKDLHAAEEVSAVVIVAAGDHQGKIRFGHYFGVAVKHMCQPNMHSRNLKSGFGIQRKYRTDLY